MSAINPLWQKALKMHGVPFVRKTQNPNGSYINDNYPLVLATYQSLKKEESGLSAATAGPSMKQQSRIVSHAANAGPRPMSKAEQKKQQKYEEEQERLRQEYRKSEALRLKYVEVSTFLDLCVAGKTKEVGKMLETYQPEEHAKSNILSMIVFNGHLSTLKLLLDHEQFKDEKYAKDALIASAKYLKPRIMHYLLDEWDVDPTENIPKWGYAPEEGKTENPVFLEALKASCSPIPGLFGHQHHLHDPRPAKVAVLTPLLNSIHMQHLDPLMYLLFMVDHASQFSLPYFSGDHQAFLSIILPYVIRAINHETDPYKKKKAAISVYKKHYTILSTTDKRIIDEALRDYNFMRNHGSKTRKFNLVKHLAGIPLENKNRKTIANVSARLLQSNKYSATSNAVYASRLPVEQMKELPTNILSHVQDFSLTSKKGGKNKRMKTRKH